MAALVTRLVVHHAQLQVGIQPGAGEVGRGDHRHPPECGRAQQVGLAVQESTDVSPDLNVRIVEPIGDVSQLRCEPAGREPGDVTLGPKRLNSHLERVEGEPGAERRVGLGTDEQPQPALIVDHGCQLVQPAKVDVPGGDRDWLIGFLG